MTRRVVESFQAFLARPALWRDSTGGCWRCADRAMRSSSAASAERRLEAEILTGTQDRRQAMPQRPVRICWARSPWPPRRRGAVRPRSPGAGGGPADPPPAETVRRHPPEKIEPPARDQPRATPDIERRSSHGQGRDHAAHGRRPRPGRRRARRRCGQACPSSAATWCTGNLVSLRRFWLTPR